MQARLSLFLMVWASGALAQTAEPHLNIIPRTEAEVARIARVLAAPRDFTAPQKFEDKPGGAATVRVMPTADAFSQHSANMEFAGEMDFKLGNALFRKAWIASPASTLASDGLGPLYNARGCQDCHLKDGRAHPPEGEGPRTGMFLRVSVPGGPAPDIAGWHATQAHPLYGGQLQDLATEGQAPEGRMEITYDPLPVTLADGTVVTLRAPRYGFTPALEAEAMVSPRVAPQMIGLGLLEAIPAADILSHEDPEDADGDGISGRAQVVPSVEFGVPMLGRFGLKAGAPTIKEQSAGAFAGDMGLSTPLHPDPWGDCTAAQTACRNAQHGQEPGVREGLEVDGPSLDLVTFYSRNLAVPARRDPANAQALQGKQVFHAAGCPACHVPAFVTHRLKDRPEQSFQLIWPYSDLLLHDMGPGLADNRPEGRASGSEWRTAPLWGIGLTEQVTGRASFLHDGRARSLLEAVLWHGGEAQGSRDAVVGLSTQDREALIAFLGSL